MARADLAKSRYAGYQHAFVSVQDEVWEFSSEPNGEDGIPVRVRRRDQVEAFHVCLGGLRHVIAIVAATNGRHIGLGIVSISLDGCDVEYQMAFGYRDAKDGTVAWMHSAPLLLEPVTQPDKELLSIALIEGDTLVFAVQTYSRLADGVEIETQRFVHQCAAIGQPDVFPNGCMYHRDILQIPHSAGVEGAA